MTLRIQCWSGPRNVSTALMYAFRERADTTVVDEPLYTHFLAVSGRGDPGRDEILASRPTDATTLVRDLILGECPTPVLYCKQIASHLLGIDPWFLTETENVLLIRDPRDVLRSWTVRMPNPSLADTGLVDQITILDHLIAAGREPLVVDARTLLADPPRVLAIVCRRLGLEVDPAMLTWPAGPKPEDGVWAPYWYEGVHASTGFGAYHGSDTPLPAEVDLVANEAQPFYQRLLDHAIA